MTKAKPARLMDRLVERENQGTCDQRERYCRDEIEALQAEFAAWEPDKLREVGAWIVREWLEEKANAASPDLDRAIAAMRDLLESSR